MAKPINLLFYGCPFEPTGYGAAARSYLHALHKAGVSLSVVNLSKAKIMSDELVESFLNRPITPTLYMCHTDPTQMAALTLPFRRSIAMTTWEGNRVPDRWIGVLDNFMEVWLPCRHNVEVFSQSIRTPIFQLPHPVTPPRLEADVSDIDRQFRLGQNDFVFYSIFTWQDRKCPLGVIQAFLESFRDESDVVLIIKTSFGLTEQRVALTAVADLIGHVGRRTADNGPRIEIASDLWTDDLVRALARRGRCDLVPVAQKFVYSDRFQNMLWADPDIHHAASLMRCVYDNRREALHRAWRGAELLRVQYSLDAIGKLAADRLAILSEQIDHAPSSIEGEQQVWPVPKESCCDSC